MGNCQFILLILLIISNRSFAKQSHSQVPETTAIEVAGSFRDIPVLKEAFIDAAPADRIDGIIVGEQGVIAGNNEMVFMLARNIADNHYGFFNSFLYTHKSQLLFGSCFTKGYINPPYPQASATKTYSGVALGRAIQLDYLTITDVDMPLVSFLKKLDPSTSAFVQKPNPTISENSESLDSFPVLEGPYLGQNPPGLVAEPFAPGIISKEGWEIEGVFAPGMNEFYFTTQIGKDTPITVIGFRLQDNVWKKYIEFKRSGEISFSPDGTRMHMAKGYKDRIGDGWSKRKSLGSMFDREDWGIMRLTASARGTYVFDDYKSDDVIRISVLKDGKRQAPKKMGAVVNTGKWTAHPFIAPDERYLIWDSERKEGFGDSDLYICFRQKDDSWGPAINMGNKVNSDKWEAFASVTPDGKYILFNRRIDDGSNNDNMNVDIYWVDAQIIEDLRPKK